MEQSTRDKLFTVIRAGMGLPAAEITLSPDECLSILKLSNRQSILPIVLRGMDKLGIADPSQALFEQHRLKSDYRVIQHDDALKRVSSALDEAGIPYIPLKGAVLRHLYPDITLRTSSDIDVLIKETDLDKAVAVLEEKTDFKTDKRNYHDVSMISSRVHLELHFSIKENMKNIDRFLSRAWEYIIPSDEGSCYQFSPDFQVFHVVAHMSYHMVHGGLGIRPFLDLWLLRTKTEYSEETIRQMFSECGILMFYEKSCQLVDAWMSGEKIPDTLELYEKYCLDSRVFGNEETIIAAKQREKRGFGYLVGRIFMSRDELATEFPEIEKKPYLIPLCQAKRWTRLLKKQKRDHVRKEMKAIKRTPRESVELFDELLKELNL